MMGNFHGIHVLNEFARYRALILDYETKYMWYTVQSFDCAHRAKKSGKSVRFTEIDQNLWNQFFDFSAIKQVPRCSHCKSTKHTVIECPLPSPPTGPISKNRFGKKSRNRKTCTKWNFSECDKKDCTWAHKCRGCGGDTPMSECSKNGKCSS